MLVILSLAGDQLCSKNFQAYHITSILKRVQVTPVDSTVDIPLPPATTSPPFVVVGLADKGFSAKITLSFSGLQSQTEVSLSEQTFVFEHWIDVRRFFIESPRFQELMFLSYTLL